MKASLSWGQVEHFMLRHNLQRRQFHRTHTNTRAAPVDTVRASMEGCYKVVENINFENFLRVMGVTEDDKIQAMIAATKQVSLIFDELSIHCLIR